MQPTLMTKAKITRLKWYKVRKGIQREFLLFLVEKPENETFWVRIDKALYRRSISPFLSSALILDTVSLLKH